MSALQAEERLVELASRNVNAQAIYKWVLAATGDKDKAEEFYNEVVAARSKAGLEPYGNMNMGEEK